jgi:hypothetical protein
VRRTWSAVIIDGVPVPTTAVSATAFVSLIVLLVLFGYLVPRWLHNERMKDKDKQIDFLASALDKRDDQVDKLLTQGQLIVDLLDDIKEEAQRR